MSNAEDFQHEFNKLDRALRKLAGADDWQEIASALVDLTSFVVSYTKGLPVRICYNQHMNNFRRGFTLVELLIVIVIIAILATISVVTYRGVQQRAETQKIESTIVSYIKTLEMYRAVHGVWPSPDDEHYAYGAICLGPTSDYPAADGFEEGQCYQNLNALDVRGHALDEHTRLVANYRQPDRRW